MFGEVVQAIANDARVSHSYKKTTQALLRFAAQNGMTLEQCSHPMFMNRSLSTLKRQVRACADLTFADYVPRKLKPKKEKKSRAKKANPVQSE